MKINFAKYLLEILLEQGKVDVPGLGRFEMKRQSASFGEGRQSLMAPRQEIIFSEQHDSNNTLLQDRIASKEGVEIDNAKASEFVGQFTSDVLKGLMDNKEVEIAYVGTIKRDADAQISFVQNEATVDKLNKYLPEVDLPQAEQVPVKKEVVTEAPAAPQEAKPIIAASKESSFRTDIKPEVTPSYVEPAKSSLGWLKWLIGILGLVFLSTILFKMCGAEDASAYKTTQQDEVTQEEGNQEETGDDTSIASEESQSTDDSEKEIDFKSEDSGVKETDMKTASDFNKDQCIVIIGSYQSDKNVRSADSKIKNKGYKVYKESHGAYTRVGVKIDCDNIDGSYSSFVQRISREFGVNAWFLSPEVKQ